MTFFVSYFVFLFLIRFRYILSSSAFNETAIKHYFEIIFVFVYVILFFHFVSFRLCVGNNFDSICSLVVNASCTWIFWETIAICVILNALFSVFRIFLHCKIMSRENLTFWNRKNIINLPIFMKICCIFTL